MFFRDRIDAGLRLGRALAIYRKEKPIILALPRGGVPVAEQVATALDAPLDVILVRKIGVPSQPELAMGAVVDGCSPLIVRNDEIVTRLEITEAEFAEALRNAITEIERRRAVYVGNRAPLDPSGCTVIIVDDGIATGASIRAALEAVRLRKPKKIILAVPVASTQTLQELEPEVDEIVCLADREDFGAIGFYYADFRQVSDNEVIEALAKHSSKSKMA